MLGACLQYFNRFPLPETDASGLPKDERKKKRSEVRPYYSRTRAHLTIFQQIINSIEWEYGKILRGDSRRHNLNKSIKKITSAITEKKGRCHQEVEIYQMQHRSEINSAVAAEAASGGVDDRDGILSIRRRVAMERLRSEDPSIQAKIKESYDTELKAKLKSKSTKTLDSPADLEE